MPKDERKTLMTKILFICHGNICRSPMAEHIFRRMAREAGRGADFDITSAATSNEEIGNGIYPPAQRVLRAHGVPFTAHAAHRVTREECERNDLILVMDRNNLRNMERMFGTRFSEKTRLLMTYAGEARDVSDPWYTGDFETAYRDIEAGCAGLLQALS